MSKPLENITVLDLTQYLPGPLATRVLEDLGANVIKIETAEGDFLRNLPPFEENVSVLFTELNKGKKSIKLNLQKDDGQKILSALVNKADVVVHSYRENRAKKLGLAFEDLRQANQQIILVELKAGFNLEAGHDLNFMALSGALQNYTTGELPKFQIADLLGGSLNLVSSLLAALYSAKTTNKAQHVEVSMLEGTKYFLNFYFKAIRENGTDTLDLLRGKAPCYNIYSTKDKKKLAIAALEPIFWSNVCSALKRNDLLDKQFDENETKELEKIFKGKKLSEWKELLPEAETTITEVVTHENEEVDFPARFNGESYGNTLNAPDLSQDAQELLEELGYSKAEILRLKSEGIV